MHRSGGMRGETVLEIATNRSPILPASVRHPAHVRVRETAVFSASARIPLSAAEMDAGGPFVHRHRLQVRKRARTDE